MISRRRDHSRSFYCVTKVQCYFFLRNVERVRKVRRRNSVTLILTPAIITLLMRFSVFLGKLVGIRRVR